MLQTYYSLQTDTGGVNQTFIPYMTANREIAAAHRVPCIDSHPRLLALHRTHPALYARLMLDPGHLSPPATSPADHAVFATLAMGLPDVPPAAEFSTLVNECLTELLPF